MKLILSVLGIMISILLGVTIYAQAEKSTELYIPIGQSPGLSHESRTVQGVIANIDYARKVLTVGVYEFTVSDQASIYIDRSQIKLSNRYGKFADLKIGEFVEVYAPKDAVVEWVKVKEKE